MVCARNISTREQFKTRIVFIVFLPLNIFIPYLVDFFVAFGTDLSNNEFKNSSETSSKREAAAIVFVFKTGAFRY